MRAAVPAIRQAAESILEHHRAQECDEHLMPFKEIIRLIPEEQGKAKKKRNKTETKAGPFRMEGPGFMS